ncbi:hypothetical protein GCK72_002801 [Caenorhabditis remanei]|uniref:Uncharacterized protein n=1 Tax=Caenorhabditis remanei TaxID=31234 RepID=A0A6A5HX21_CAERE|nr:hypothetical protein GCK72_002801 [Caenorhabditis remanei]KAF1770977.1 hypothetical protein GCK72_002801 [Caenorhabditis remanei]
MYGSAAELAESLEFCGKFTGSHVFFNATAIDNDAFSARKTAFFTERPIGRQEESTSEVQSSDDEDEEASSESGTEEEKRDKYDWKFWECFWFSASDNFSSRVFGSSFSNSSPRITLVNESEQKHSSWRIDLLNQANHFSQMSSSVVDYSDFAAGMHNSFCEPEHSRCTLFIFTVLLGLFVLFIFFGPYVIMANSVAEEFCEADPHQKELVANVKRHIRMSPKIITIVDAWEKTTWC